MEQEKVSKKLFWFLGGTIVLLIAITIVAFVGKKEKKEKIVPKPEEQKIEKQITNEVFVEGMKIKLVKAENLGADKSFPGYNCVRVEISQENIIDSETLLFIPVLVDKDGNIYDALIEEPCAVVPPDKDCTVRFFDAKIKPKTSMNCVFIYSVPQEATNLRLKFERLQAPQYIDLGLWFL